MAATLDGSSRNAVNQNAFYRVGLGGMTIDNIENVFVVYLVILEYMLAYAFDGLFKFGHFFFISQHSNYVTACRYTQFREKRLDHL